MVAPYIIENSIVYGSLFGLMAIGLTLTYLTTKVPNFAYGSFVAIGIYTSFSIYKVDRINPYFGTPIGFFIGGMSSVVMYVAILRVLARRGSSLVGLMISTFAVDIGFLGILQIYSDKLYYGYSKIDAKQFYPLGSDFSLFGLPGMLYIAPISLVFITLGLFLLLTKTKFGIAMRASVENPNLARVAGVDVEKVYIFAWFLAGGFAALSGTLYPIWLPAGVNESSLIIVEIFASSVLGGLSSIYGAAVGGVIIGASEILLTAVASDWIGPGVYLYQKGIPIVIMIITLLFLPQGIVSVKWRSLLSLGRDILSFNWRRLFRLAKGE